MGDNDHDRLTAIVGDVLDANRLVLGASYTSSPAIREALVTILAISIEASSHNGDADIRIIAQRMAHQLREDILSFLLDRNDELFAYHASGKAKSVG